MPHLLGEDEILERSLRFAKEAATMTPIFLLASFLTASMGRKGKPASLAEVAALFGRRFMPALTGLVALGPLEYSLREPLRLIAPESEFFAAPAPLRPETNVGQHSPPAVKPNAVSRFREDVTTPSSVDPLPAADVDPYELAERESTGQFSATHPNRWEENPTGDGRGALSHVFETDDDQSHNAPSSLQAAAAGSQMGGMDTFWAISRVGEEDYCPPTMASRLATGTICCLVLLRPQLIPVQIIIACLASAVTGMFAPTYEDVRAYEQRRANQLAEHRAGIESRERR